MSLIPECPTCKFIASTVNVVFETEHWKVTLANDQSYLGRSFVTLLDHKESLSALSPEEWKDFEALVRRLETGYEKAFGSSRPFNWACMMNDAFKEPSPTPHVHWHCRPRHNMSTTINGWSFEDPDYAHHYERGRTQIVDKATLDIIAGQIKPHL